MTRVKICGIRYLHEARWAVENGAWAIGMVFAPSRRRITPAQAYAINNYLDDSVVKVGVFVNEDPERVKIIARFCQLDMIQLHGDESPEYCSAMHLPVIKAFRPAGPVTTADLERWPVRACLFDTGSAGDYGGTGQCFNHEWIQGLAGDPRLIVAGGLTPGNVGDTIRQLCPMAVDVSSGVEFPDGGKDPELIRLFMQKVKEAINNADSE